MAIRVSPNEIQTTLASRASEDARGERRAERLAVVFRRAVTGVLVWSLDGFLHQKLPDLNHSSNSAAVGPGRASEPLRALITIIGSGVTRAWPSPRAACAATQHQNRVMGRTA